MLVGYNSKVRRNYRFDSVKHESFECVFICDKSSESRVYLSKYFFSRCISYKYKKIVHPTKRMPQTHVCKHDCFEVKHARIYLHLILEDTRM